MNASPSANAVGWNANPAEEPGTSITMQYNGNSQLPSGRGPKSKKYFKVVFCLVCLLIVSIAFIVGLVIYQGFQLQKEFVNVSHKGFEQINNEGSNKKANDPFKMFNSNKFY